MKTEVFDFYVPDELIAQVPTKNRSDSRLLVYYRDKDLIKDSYTKDIPDFLSENDFLVFNNSKVIPARIFVNKKETGRTGEILILKIIDEYCVEVITDRSRKYPVGSFIVLPDEKAAEVIEERDDGVKVLKTEEPIFNIEYIETCGNIPLPPYIRKAPDKEDRARYQTVYSKSYGSAAAPTAGLHFDEDLFVLLSEKKIDHAFVSLHVGLGTFQPIYSQNIEDHKIHKEEYFINEREANKINEAIKDGKRIIPVGTTSLRTLESAFDNEIKWGESFSELYIYPSYQFKVTGGLITNFHTPKSSLAVLVSALVGVDKLLEIYKYAVDKKYRFFSYGDAMLIL